jgi:superoxide oxidase
LLIRLKCDITNKPKIFPYIPEIVSDWHRFSETFTLDTTIDEIAMENAMNQKIATGRYDTLTIGLHWLMLVLIASAYATIELREFFPKGSDPRTALKSLHYMLGLSVLALIWLRILVRFSSRKPDIQPPPPYWQKISANLMHYALYALMIGLPLLGWLALSAEGKPIPFFGLQLPALIAENKATAKQIEEIHEFIGQTGYFLIGLHAVMALFHHYIVRDNTLLRMLPGRR